MASFHKALLVKDIEALLGDWGYPTLIAALAASASEYAMEAGEDGKPDPDFAELAKRLRAVADWADGKGSF
jgi:hypothetical protein